MNMYQNTQIELLPEIAEGLNALAELEGCSPKLMIHRMIMQRFSEEHDLLIITVFSGDEEKVEKAERRRDQLLDLFDDAALKLEAYAYGERCLNCGAVDITKCECCQIKQ